jgi:hypothetical protein
MSFSASDRGILGKNRHGDYLMKHHLFVAVCAVASLTIAACSKSDRPTTAQVPSATPSAAPAQSPPKSTDPCTFLTEKDLESALGYVFTTGKPTQGEPSCTFTATSGDSVIVAIPTASVSDAEFNSWKQMAGADAEPVSGVGDAAYFWNSRLYIHSGNRTATISVVDRDVTPELKAGLRKLGEMAASRLR